MTQSCFNSMLLVGLNLLVTLICLGADDGASSIVLLEQGVRMLGADSIFSSICSSSTYLCAYRVKRDVDKRIEGRLSEGSERDTEKRREQEGAEQEEV